MGKSKKTPSKPVKQAQPKEALWPFLAAVGAFLLVMAAMWAGGTYLTGGTFTYALDDAYIHMALAKNLAVHGVFGATPFEFTSASSSPLWTLLLAVGFKVMGVQAHLPIVFTLVISVSLLFVADEALVRFRVPPLPRFVGLLWIVLAAPLAPIVFGGMEHPAQLLADVAFLTAASFALASDDAGWDRSAWVLVGLAFAVSAIRYEGVLLVGVVAALYVLRRRFRHAAALAAAGILPVIAWGLYSRSQGGFFLPNPVLVKGTAPSSGVAALITDPVGYGQRFAQVVVPTVYPLLFLVALVGLFLYIGRTRGASLWEPANIFAWVSLAVTGVHLVFGDVGWFYRYENYMMVLLGMSAVIQFAAIAPIRTVVDGRRDAALTVAVALCAITLIAGGWRGWVAMTSVPYAMKNVYEQQYQMAQFLKANTQFDSVAIGDLGAISFYNDDLRILDLEGLAENGQPLERLGRYNLDAKEIAVLAKENEAQIAVVFPGYFDTPEDWVEVGSWRITANLVAAKDTVAFYAIPPTDPDELASALESYIAGSLPQTVLPEIVAR